MIASKRRADWPVGGDDVTDGEFDFVSIAFNYELHERVRIFHIGIDID